MLADPEGNEFCILRSEGERAAAERLGSARMSDMWSTVATERGALAADLADLSDRQWKTPSLCDGWTVRDVLAHQTGTASMSTPKFLTRMAAAGFRFPVFANREIRRHLGDSPRATLAEFRDKQHSTSCPPGTEALVARRGDRALRGHPPAAGHQPRLPGSAPSARSSTSTRAPTP